MALQGRPATRRNAVLAWLQSNPGLHTAEEIGSYMDMRKDYVSQVLAYLIKEGKVVKGAYGKYQAII